MGHKTCLRFPRQKKKKEKAKKKEKKRLTSPVKAEDHCVTMYRLEVLVVWEGPRCAAPQGAITASWLACFFFLLSRAK